MLISHHEVMGNWEHPFSVALRRMDRLMVEAIVLLFP